MNDAQMLLLAAKAIGATEYGGPDDCRPAGVVLLNGVPTEYEGRGEFGHAWNPLKDRGQCFELAVHLQLTVHNRQIAGGFVNCSADGRSYPSVSCDGPPGRVTDVDIDASCRAIVWAAASIQSEREAANG